MWCGMVCYARVEIIMGTLRVWNAGGVAPGAARPAYGHGVKRQLGRDRTLPDDQQGLIMLGAPLGSQSFVGKTVQDTRRDHARL